MQACPAIQWSTYLPTYLPTYQPTYLPMYVVNPSADEREESAHRYLKGSTTDKKVFQELAMSTRLILLLFTTKTTKSYKEKLLTTHPEVLISEVIQHYQPKHNSHQFVTIKY